MIRSTVRVTVAAAGTEYQLPLPPLVLRLRVTPLNNLPAAVSLVAGQVATFNGVGVAAGAEWDTGLISYAGAVLYYASPQPNSEIDVEVYTPSTIDPTAGSGYDTGFDLGFES